MRDSVGVVAILFTDLVGSTEVLDRLGDDAFLFGARPTENNIVSASGPYAGRTGRLSVSGTVDMRGAPSTVPYDGVGVLVFND